MLCGVRPCHVVRKRGLGPVWGRIWQAVSPGRQIRTCLPNFRPSSPPTGSLYTGGNKVKKRVGPGSSPIGRQTFAPPLNQVQMNLEGTANSVDVIVAAWNRASTIERAVLSALAQPEVRSVIVIDDCSTDDTRTQALRIAAEHVERVTVIAL